MEAGRLWGLNLNTARYRTLDPQLGRWWQIDPEVEQFEAWSAYNSNLDNPILHTDPEGDCTDCPSELTVGGLLETAFYDAKHALFNVGAYGVQLATGSEGRYVADYQTDGSGTPIFETSYQYVTNETQGQKALSLAGDVLQVASLANGGASSLTLAKTTNQSKQTVKAVEGAKNATKTNVTIDKPYKRPSGSVTQKQRQSVQNKPCVDCGKTEKKMVADHKKALVEEYYETGTIDVKKMRDVNSVQPQCPTCSAKQGAEKAQYSKQQKKAHGFD